jgi:hypothetical protein
LEGSRYSGANDSIPVSFEVLRCLILLKRGG